MVMVMVMVMVYCSAVGEEYGKIIVIHTKWDWAVVRDRAQALYIRVLD